MRFMLSKNSSATTTQFSISCCKKSSFNICHSCRTCSTRWCTSSQHVSLDLSIVLLLLWRYSWSLPSWAWHLQLWLKYFAMFLSTSYTFLRMCKPACCLAYGNVKWVADAADSYKTTVCLFLKACHMGVMLPNHALLHSSVGQWDAIFRKTLLDSRGKWFRRAVSGIKEDYFKGLCRNPVVLFQEIADNAAKQLCVCYR